MVESNQNMPPDAKDFHSPKDTEEEKVAKRIPSAKEVNEIGKRLFPEAILDSSDDGDDFPYFSSTIDDCAVSVSLDEGGGIVVNYDFDRGPLEYFPAEFGVDDVVNTAGNIDEKMRVMKKYGLDPQVIGDLDLRKYLHGDLDGASYSVGKKVFEEADYVGKLIEVYKKFFNSEIDLEKGFFEYVNRQEDGGQSKSATGAKAEATPEESVKAQMVQSQIEKIKEIPEDVGVADAEVNYVPPVVSNEPPANVEKAGLWGRIRKFFG